MLKASDKRKIPKDAKGTKVNQRLCQKLCKLEYDGVVSLKHWIIKINRDLRILFQVKIPPQSKDEIKITF